MSANSDTATPPVDADLVTLEINGVEVKARKGDMIIRAADAAGITIPRFCYHRKLSVAANCRMCLVEIEKAPKPMPACATPVGEGMKVFTSSEVARTAQRGVMEFLLINHPLDCPICDQGGECQLQDLAVGYGGDISRYVEAKRIVKDKNIGPLIATEMTRCIHCTRCVRFGKEIAGVMELGATGRGEHMRIGTYVEMSVDSELSGNVIDLCPVGALTSKPYRYSARPWELTARASVSPHDCVGANIRTHVRSGQVMRVVPDENEDINETWISDRDRFAYEGLASADRLTVPMIRVNGQWQEADWNSALEFTLRGLARANEQYGPGQLGALAAPHCTLEEFYLLQKMMRGLGSGNVDHRLRETDNSDDAHMPVFPYLGQTLPELEQSQAVLLVGGNPRKDQPLVGLRLRKAQRQGATVSVINAVDYEFTEKPANKVIGTPQQMVEALAAVLKATADIRGQKPAVGLESLLGRVSVGDTEKAVARSLIDRAPATILLGKTALGHVYASQLRLLANALAEMTGARLGFLPDANSAAAWLAGCVPHRGVAGAATSVSGRSAYAMLKEPLKAYILLGLEPELDTLDGGRTRAALEGADFVVSLTSYKPATGAMAFDCADVLLPMAPFTETAGTHINAAGQRQAFNGVVQPLGETRPAWKILRVLGSLMETPGFEYDDIEQVRADINTDNVTGSARMTGATVPAQLGGKVLDLVRIAEHPIYAVDAIVRRAPALQATHDNPGSSVRINAREAQRLGIDQDDKVRVRMLEGDALIAVTVDARIPDGVAWVPAGYPETSSLGAHGQVSLSKV